MAIIATLIKAEEHKTYWKMEVEYNDEGEIVVDTFRFSGTVEALKALARAKVIKHEEVDSFNFASIVGASIDVTPVVVEPPPPPTAEEIAKLQWFNDWRQLKEINIILEEAPALATVSHIAFRDSLQVDVETNWLDSYLGDL